MVQTNPVWVSGGPDDIMQLVRALRSRDMAQGIDFDFEYEIVHSNIDWAGYAKTIGKGATFYFREAKYSTFFALQYGNNKPQPAA